MYDTMHKYYGVDLVMGDTMSYNTIRLPEPLITEIDSLIKTQYRGYRSRAEFIAEAVRRYLDQIDREHTMEVSAE